MQIQLSLEKDCDYINRFNSATSLCMSKHTYIYKDEQPRLLPNTRVRSENAGVFTISVAICFGSTGLLTGLLVIPDL